MLFKHLALIAGLTEAGQTSNIRPNWQKKGLCGVPTIQANHELFDNMAARKLSESDTDQQELQQEIYEVMSSGMDEEAKLKTIRRLKANHVKTHGINFEGRRKRRQAEADESDLNNNRTIDGRIVGGAEARQNSWPWQVFVKFGFDCGGALIDEYWVATAAHCINTNSRNPYVRVGAHLHSSDIYNDPRLGVKIAVERTIIHPNYNAQNFKYDLALLKLKEPAMIRDDSGTVDLSTVAPICLSQDGTCFEKTTPCVVTGWGVEDANTWDRQDFLQEVAVRTMSNEECTSHPTYQAYFDPESMLCAGWIDGGKDACAGDSGGPLVCRVPDGAGGYGNQWVLYGLVSWGLGCAKAGQPGVYTNIPKLSDWISDTIRSVDKIEVVSDPEFNFKDEHGNSKCSSWNSILEYKWKTDIQTIFAEQAPALNADKKEELATENEALNTACSISNPMMEFNGMKLTPDSSNPHHFDVDLASFRAGDEFLFSPNPEKVFWWNKWTPIDQVYPKNQNCSFLFTNTDPAKMIKVEIIRSKIDCAGWTAKKSKKRLTGKRVGDELIVLSDTSNSRYGQEVRCPEIANVKKESIVMIGAGTIKVQLVTDDFRMTDYNGYDSDQQRYDGGFIAKVSSISRYSGCAGKDVVTLGKNQQYVVKSPGYPKFYGQEDQCRMHFKAGPGLKLVYSFSKKDLATRSDQCSPDKNDIVMWLKSENGCSTEDLIDNETGTFKSGAIQGQQCGKYDKKTKRPKNFLDFDTPQTNLCMVFVAQGVAQGDHQNAKTGRWYMRVRAIDENQSTTKKKKKRKRRSIGSGIPVGPLGIMD